MILSTFTFYISHLLLYSKLCPIWSGFVVMYFTRYFKFITIGYQMLLPENSSILDLGILVTFYWLLEPEIWVSYCFQQVYRSLCGRVQKHRIVKGGDISLLILVPTIKYKYHRKSMLKIHGKILHTSISSLNFQGGHMTL